jgi:hypothetical protein
LVFFRLEPGRDLHPLSVREKGNWWVIELATSLSNEILRFIVLK